MLHAHSANIHLMLKVWGGDMKVTNIEQYKAEKWLDGIIARKGNCCAGCKYWLYGPGIEGARIGECDKSNWLSTQDNASRLGLIAYTGPSLPGKALVKPDEYCSNFEK